MKTTLILLKNIENIIKTKYQIKTQIAHLEKSKVPNPNNTLNIKLLEIPLPKFSGKTKELSAFKLQFNNIITSNKQLSKAQKLHYLSAALINEVRVFHISLFQALKDRYDNKRVIFCEILQTT